MTASNAIDESRVLAAMHCRPNAPKLEGAELATLLSHLPGWTQVEIRIEKTFRFADYYRTMAFVNAVASIAHREDHHPDLAVHYDRCVVAWSTHSAGGLTLNDGICAAKTDDAAAV
jgi:4a-hydroxytetrahydrobiopterin dehydratase